MSFLEHLEELRSRLWKCLVALALGVLICWVFSRPILAWLTRPLEEAFSSLSVIRPAEAFLNRMKAAFIGGIFVASPVLFYHLWAFVSPGLFPRERRYTLPFLGFSVLFFLCGATFSYHIAMPMAAGFLAEQGVGYEQNVTLDSAFTFASRMLLALGVLFELPILIFFLSRLGIVTPVFLIRQFKYAVLIIFIIAAVITPTPDVITQTVFAVPMIILYWIGIGVSWLADRRSRSSSDEDGPQ
jgi:sec-independent protein translocase protein TatC